MVEELAERDGKRLERTILKATERRIQLEQRRAGFKKQYFPSRQN